MIVTRAPLRISYAGGGTDYPSYFNNNEGNIVGTTFNQFTYCYINELSPISREKIRFNYRITESVEKIDDLLHPVLRETLKLLGNQTRLNIGTFSDIPSGTGLGGSSSFAVALISGLSLQFEMNLTLNEIAKLAIKVERELLREDGGWQDQLHATFGGLRHYKFSENKFNVSEELIANDHLPYLSDRHLLVWSGSTREASKYSAVTNAAIKNENRVLADASRLADQLTKSLKSAESARDAYQFLSNAVEEGWEYKKEFSAPPSESVKDIIRVLKNHGVHSLKLLGAGHEGFILCLAEPEVLQAINKHFGKSRCIKPKLISTGVEVLINA